MGYFEKLSGGASRPTQAAQEPKTPPAPAEPVQEAKPMPQEVPAPVPAEQEPPKADAAPVPEAAQAPEDAKKAPDDAAERRAHEAAEAKRKAEWDARQAEKRAHRQARLDELAAMSDEDAIKASTARVGADVEKLTRRNMKEAVAEHVQAVCRRDPTFARRTMLPEKSMVHCFWYINRQAKEFMEQEIKAENPNPASGMYGGDVPDDMVYQWAVDYFDGDDIPEDKRDDEKFISKPYVGKSSVKKAKGKTGTKPKQEPTKAPDVEGQISFLGEAG